MIPGVCQIIETCDVEEANRYFADGALFLCSQGGSRRGRAYVLYVLGVMRNKGSGEGQNENRGCRGHTGA